MEIATYVFAVVGVVAVLFILITLIGISIKYVRSLNRKEKCTHLNTSNVFVYKKRYYRMCMHCSKYIKCDEDGNVV